MQKRKVIQIAAVATTSDGRHDYLYALCDDGTLWSMKMSGGDEDGWEALDGVPQPEEVGG